MLPTLALFAREWSLVTGRLRPDAGAATFAALRALLGVLLPALRGAAATGIVALVVEARLAPAMLLGAALLAAGVLTRLTAFASAAGLTLILGDGAALPMATYLGTLVLLLAGGGRAVLWNPEDRWLFMRAGSPRRLVV